MGIRNCNLGSAVILVFLLLVAVAPNSVLGSRTRLLDETQGALAVNQSESTTGSGTGSDFHALRMLRTLMEQRRRQSRGQDASPGIHPPPVDDQVPKPVPPAPVARQSRFASLFRSLAKGSPTPTPGTPSPGHN